MCLALESDGGVEIFAIWGRMWYGQHLCFDGNVKKMGLRRVEQNEHEVSPI